MVRNYRFTLNKADQLDLAQREIRVLDSDLVHQINHVLRLNKDSKEEISFITGEDTKIYYAKPKSQSAKEALFSIESEALSERELSRDITFYIPVIKADAFEFMLRKLTELGVQSMIPVAFERSQKQSIEKLNNSKQLKRLEKIIREATEQCEGSKLAQLSPMIKFEELMNQLDQKAEGELRIFASERLASQDGLDTNTRKNANKMTLLVGPEGGLTDYEAEKLESFGFNSHSLGKRLLKAETAAIVLFAHLDCF